MGGTRACVAPVGIVRPLRGRYSSQLVGQTNVGPINAVDHADLTIARLAERAAVLPFDADRLRALFRKARIVDRQDAAAVGHQRAQPRPHRSADQGESVMKCCSAW